jgi:hypothetical protein
MTNTAQHVSEDTIDLEWAEWNVARRLTHPRRRPTIAT